MRYLKGAIKDATERGEFTIVASTDTLDRDGEILDVGCFNPLPATVPIHAFHNFSDPVGLGIPRYEGRNLIVTGTFARTERGQEIRQLVLDGVIGHTSVGYMTPVKEEKNGVLHVTKAELLEVSFTSVSSNREAVVIAAKSARRGSAHDELLAWRLKIAAAEAQLVLAEAERAAPRPAHAGPLTKSSIDAILADAKSFLAELNQPATTAAPRPRVSKVPQREVRCLYDVLAARNAKSFDDQPAVEEPPAPAPFRRDHASAYERSRGLPQKDY